jgi:hypothetical protein
VLLQVAHDPAADRGNNLLELYTHFVAAFEFKLSPLRVVQLLAAVARQYYPSRPYRVEGES